MSRELKTDGKRCIFSVCRLPWTSCLTSLIGPQQRELHFNSFSIAVNHWIDVVDSSSMDRIIVDKVSENVLEAHSHRYQWHWLHLTMINHAAWKLSLRDIRVTAGWVNRCSFIPISPQMNKLSTLKIASTHRGKKHFPVIFVCNFFILTN